MKDSVNIKYSHIALFVVMFFLICLGGGGFIANKYLNRYETLLEEKQELQEEIKSLKYGLDEKLEKNTLSILQS